MDGFLPLTIIELGAEEDEFLEHLYRSQVPPELRCYVTSSGSSFVCCKVGETRDKVLVAFPSTRGLRVSQDECSTELTPMCRPPVVWLWKNRIEWEHAPYAETEYFFLTFLLEEANEIIPDFIRDAWRPGLEEKLNISGFTASRNPIETQDALKSIGRCDLLEDQKEETPPTLH